MPLRQLPSILTTGLSPQPIAAAATRGRVHSHAGLGSQDRFGVNARADMGFVAVAVCDGHGPHGAAVAETAAATLMRAAEIEARAGVAVGDAVRHTMRAAASRVEAMDGAQTSGTTAAVAMIDLKASRFAVASVGDCEVVLVKAGSGVKRGRPTIDLLTVAHRTYDKEERARVEAAGGRVQAGYVIVSEVEGAGARGGKYVKSLNITRSLGDLDMRQYGIISEPHVVEMDVPGEEAMLIIATDGLWGSACVMNLSFVSLPLHATFAVDFGPRADTEVVSSANPTTFFFVFMDGRDEEDMPPHVWFSEAVAKHIKTPTVVVRRLFQMVGKPEDDATVICMRMDL